MDNIAYDLGRAELKSSDIDILTEDLRTILKRICSNHPVYKNRKPAQMNVEQLKTLTRRIAKFESNKRKKENENNGRSERFNQRNISKRSPLQAQN